MADAHRSHSHNRPSHTHQDHTHGALDPALLTTERGIWAVKWSLIGLTATAFLQLIVFFVSGSIALLADTVHNIADAATAIPLWIAFTLARRPPSRRDPEDLSEEAHHGVLEHRHGGLLSHSHQ